MSAHRHGQYIWVLIELPNGKREWYCLSKVLKRALLWEKNVRHNRFWRNTLNGKYLTVARSPYIHNYALLTVGRVVKVRITHKRVSDWHWTRNQFITAKHLDDLEDAYNYLKHDYSWLNRIRIKHALKKWQKISHRRKKILRAKRAA
ncbi:hypothetical protein J2Z60_001363 [Lactobacillus colini]|uniref:HNH endonuclease n=1 Tax=Lactobacillus colini TaxID=1819254 RepID=A0ABS4MFS3_9LACO|nr:hypothetical protein [Lactobacillus colini]MBP2058186.1 hypothetical protein [Lactobacillus colini]